MENDFFQKTKNKKSNYPFQKKMQENLEKKKEHFQSLWSHCRRFAGCFNVETPKWKPSVYFRLKWFQHLHDKLNWVKWIILNINPLLIRFQSPTSQQAETSIKKFARSTQISVASSAKLPKESQPVFSQINDDKKRFRSYRPAAWWANSSQVLSWESIEAS